jgi:hypothetical protein
MSELARCDLCLQIPNVAGRGIGIERRSVYEFQWPGPYVEGYILPPQLSSSLDHATQSDMRKWAPHIRIDLNGLHAWTLRRNPGSACREIDAVGHPTTTGAKYP